jgi:hypothetical protein
LDRLLTLFGLFQVLLILTPAHIQFGMRIIVRLGPFGCIVGPNGASH